MVSAPFPILRMMITTGDLNVIVNSKLILMNAHLKKTVVALMMFLGIFEGFSIKSNAAGSDDPFAGSE